MGSTDWLLLACRMPSCATRRSSSWVAGRASRAVARNRSRPASHALTMASRWGGTPVDESQRTRVTTARAMWRAMPACRRSSSSIRPCGRRGAALAALDLEANLAMRLTIRAGRALDIRSTGVLATSWTYARSWMVQTIRGWLRAPARFVRTVRWSPPCPRPHPPPELEALAALLHEGEHAPPGVVARILPLLVGAVEEAVRRPFVHVRLIRRARRRQLPLEILVLLRRGRLVGAGDQDQQRRSHLRDVRLAAHRSAVEADAAAQSWVQGGLVPRVGPAEAEADREHGFGRAAIL